MCNTYVPGAIRGQKSYLFPWKWSLKSWKLSCCCWKMNLSLLQGKWSCYCYISIIEGLCTTTLTILFTYIHYILLISHKVYLNTSTDYLITSESISVLQIQRKWNKYIFHLFGIAYTTFGISWAFYFGSWSYYYYFLFFSVI